MTMPIPANLKAATTSTVAAHLLEPSDARNLLTRLANSPMADRAAATANLAAQLAKASVQAAHGTMEELTAYVRLFNRIVATGGADLVASEFNALVPHTVRPNSFFQPSAHTLSFSFSTLGKVVTCTVRVLVQNVEQH